MSASLRGSNTSSLSEILQMIVSTRQTGYLKMKEVAREGFVAIENGTIVHARTGAYTALDALFQFVHWREATIRFHERPIPADLSRDLAVYDPQVLITELMAKVEEMAAPRHTRVAYGLVGRKRTQRTQRG